MSLKVFYKYTSTWLKILPELLDRHLDHKRRYCKALCYGDWND